MDEMNCTYIYTKNALVSLLVMIFSIPFHFTFGNLTC